MGKGGGFENEVSKELSLWFTEGRRKDIFGRSDGSGSRFTRTSNNESIAQAGDITFTDEEGIPLIKEWCIECKTGYGHKKKIKDDEGNLVTSIQAQWDIMDCIDSKKSIPAILAMWAQCHRDAILVNRQPVLIFRRNLRSKCIAFSRSYFGKLAAFFGSPQNATYITLKTQDDTITIMALKDFFEWIPDVSITLKG